MLFIQRSLLAFILVVSNLYAKEPTMELGAGVASLSFPDYLGSKSRQLLTLPIPYFRYRGEYLKVDEDGLNSKLFGVDGLRLDLSINGSLPASSESNSAREGMPDLELIGEVGPKLVYSIYKDRVGLFEFEFPLRAVFSTDFSNINYVGITSRPQLKYRLIYSKIQWTFKSGVIFSNQNYNSYFYEVSNEHKTESRALYKPEAGFGGFRNRASITYQKERWWFGVFISHFNLSRAVYKKSPLLETNTATYIGASAAYIFYTKL